MASSSSKESLIFNFRPNGLQITMILTFEIFGRARNHGKKFLKLCQTSFSGIVYYRALYRFSNKSYDENKTNFGGNFTLLVAEAIVSAIVFQLLFRILWHMQSSLIGYNNKNLCFRYNSQHTKFMMGIWNLWNHLLEYTDENNAISYQYLISRTKHSGLIILKVR